MTIEQSDKIDGVGFDHNSDTVVLIISDHLEWAGNPNHFHMLENKIDSYIGFIQSGQIFDTVKRAIDKRVEIRLIYKFHPPNDAIVILESVIEQLKNMNIIFSYEKLPTGY